MQTINVEIGKRVRKLRESQKLSREKLAEAAGISAQFLADIEYGKKGMTTTTLYKLCLALGVSADLLVFGDTTDTELSEDRLQNISVEKRKTIKQILNLMIKLSE